MDTLNTFRKVSFFYLNIFSLVFVGKEFWCKCDFCKSCCQKNKIYPNQLQQKDAY